MRPRGFFACYDELSVFAVVEGYDNARRACGGRRTYRTFRTRLDAEEWAAWFDYQREAARAARRVEEDRLYEERRRSLGLTRTKERTVFVYLPHPRLWGGYLSA